jgi:hypothetical protein
MNFFADDVFETFEDNPTEKGDQFELDPDLNDEARHRKLLRGVHMQQLCALNNLDSIATGPGKAEAVLPGLDDALREVLSPDELLPDDLNELSELQQAAASSLQRLMSVNTVEITGSAQGIELTRPRSQKCRVSSLALHSGILPINIMLLDTITTQTALDAAILLLDTILPQLSFDAVKKELLPVALAKSKITAVPLARAASCRIVGAVAKAQRMSAVDAEGVLIDGGVLQLCQDTEASVRKCMALELEVAARIVGQTEGSTAEALVSELVELCEDEDEQVVAAGFSSLMSLADFFCTGPCGARVLAVLEATFLSKDAALTANLLLMFASKVGLLVTKLRQAALVHAGGDAGAMAGSLLQKAMQLLSHRPPHSAAVRHALAFNLPALAHSILVGSAPPTSAAEAIDRRRQYSRSIAPFVSQYLVRDEAARVRRAVAAGLHVLGGMLAPKLAADIEWGCVRSVETMAVQLMRDRVQEVRCTMMESLPPLLAVRSCASGAQEVTQTQEEGVCGIVASLSLVAWPTPTLSLLSVSRAQSHILSHAYTQVLSSPSVWTS